MDKILKINLEYSMVSQDEKNLLKEKVLKINKMIKEKTGEGSKFTDWLSWPIDYDKDEVERMISKADSMRKSGVEKLLVIGIGGSYLGAQSAIDFIKGKMDAADKVIFGGINMSSSHIKQIERQLDGVKWGICVISKSGTTLEPALSFRHFKTLLENKEGIENAKDLIVAVTDGNKGALKTLADKKGYETYVVPDGIGGRFSGTTPVGMFPMAFAEIDIKSVLKGSEKAMKDLSSEWNDAYEYAATRFILNTKKNKISEIFTTYDYDLTMMAEWWKQLFGESEGKDRKGIMPNSVAYSSDLHSLGQIIQDGVQNFFETTLWVEEDQSPIKVQSNDDNLDGLNYLTGKTFHEINKQAFNGVLKAHHEGSNTPNIIFTIKDKSEESLGYLWYFFFMSVTMSGYLLGVNPFNQPGVELYKANMFKNLKG